MRQISGQAAGQAIEAIRIATALLLLIHGAYRALSGGVEPFGLWLEAQGFPAGYGWALAVTVYEWVGPALILSRRWVSLAALGHIAILCLGIAMVHLPEGWFVVGGGRNGMEYSVLLITCLAATAWAYRKGADQHMPAGGAAGQV